jgi:predicted PurR-regulated permease PerM
MTPLDRAAWLSLRALLVLGGVVAGMLVVARLKIVLIPVAVALLLTAPLRPVAARLERRIGRSAASIVCVAGLVVVVVGTLGAAGAAVAGDAGELRTAFGELVDDVESWLVDRGVDRARIDDVRADLAARGPSLLRGAASGAVVAAEVLAGLLLALILSIFLLRDGDAFVEGLARRSPPRRAARIRLGAAASWTALRRYLLGAALLGTVEALVIGVTVGLVGSPLAVPVAAFTFLAAFVPIVGAVVSGVVAVAAALVGGGPAAALVVAAVAIVVQQLDGDLLAPLIYGRATKLHPAAVLVAIATGTALGGLAGAVLAVPVLTVAVTVARATGDEEVEAEVRGPVTEAPATPGG